MSQATTPMMRQYRRIKGELPPGVLLLFRLGDFYEMFFEDAQEAAPILDIAFTKRNDVPMCGVPYHAAEGYIAKLVKAGRKVAVCDQVEEASASKGIVRREVTRIITAGTVTEESVLESDRYNFLAGVCRDGDAYGLALLDLSTGSFFAEEAGTPDALRESLKRLAPTECLVPSAQAEDEGLRDALFGCPGIQQTSCDDWSFGYDAAREELTRHFGVHSLEGFGCEGNTAVAGAAGGVLCYVKGDLRRNVDHVRTFHVRHRGETMLLDDATCVNLDIASLRGGRGQTTLLSVLDSTKTAMGARTLRDWVLRPLVDAPAIIARHDAVDALQRDRVLMRELTESFGEVRDIERLGARASAGGGNARDLMALGQSLSKLPDVKRRVEGHACATLADLGASIVLLPELVDLVERAIADEPPITVREGGIIRDGYDAGLDELRRLASEGRQWLAEYQVREQKRTGIKTLKVRHNRVFGYYIEVSKGQLENVPEDYVRKQTLVNAERFFTPELKEYESKVLGAQDRAVALEYDLFLDVRKAAADEIDRIQSSARAIGCLDVLASFADRALALGYVRPEVTTDRQLVIRGGRHPVVEQMPEAERFVPNDALLDCEQNQIIIITGPNMAGKSTYIRQVAL
ncbi:MAG: DNA mismatch repair protein MutS, partial [Lentisphaerae bacterium]|nr:DNA mismatch repair protein MutS [Lentisphaerota bacterium]